MTAHEVDIKGLEAAVRGEGVESPREEIARLRRQVEADSYELDISKEVNHYTVSKHYQLHLNLYIITTKYMQLI